MFGTHTGLTGLGTRSLGFIGLLKSRMSGLPAWPRLTPSNSLSDASKFSIMAVSLASSVSDISPSDWGSGVDDRDLLPL